MMEHVRGYLLGIISAALLISLAQALIPGQRMRRAAGLTGGLILILVVLAPLRTISFADIAQQMSRLWMDADAAQTGISVDNRDLIAAIIKDKTEAYILDKAGQLGCRVTVQVEVEADAQYPYPCAAVLIGTWTEEQREALRSYMSADLAIPEDAQTWNES